MADLVIRGGTLVTSDALLQADIAIQDGRIEAIASQLPSAKTEIDARGLFVFPAVVDGHVHFNEPGRADWEGAATGSRALAAGGGAVFIDMPLNSTPCTVDAREFDRKRAALDAASIADFALWGGLVPGNLPDMAELAERGVVGFKAFLCDSGLPEFPRADDQTLFDGLTEAARLGLPVAVHAESEELTRSGGRPVLAELEAIQRAAFLAGQAGAKLHIVHISSGSGVALAAEARARGVDVSIETCPHYLAFTDQDLERLGTVAKCAPPLRDAAEREALWKQLLHGAVDIVGSDHSPAPPHMKTGELSKVWGGIAGVQSTLAVLLEHGHFERGLPLPRIASLLAGEPARRFRLPRKGRLEVGYDADLAIVDLAASHTLKAEHLMQRHALSPYIGRTFRGCVVRTMRRGETIFRDGRITAQTHGKFIRPL